MNTRVKVATAVSAACVMLAFTVATSSAATVQIMGGGGAGIRAVTERGLVFSSTEIGFSCPVTLRTRIPAESRGTLSITPDPTRNPFLASIIEGRAEERCSGITFEMTVLGFETGTQWLMYTYRVSGTRTSLYIERAQILIGDAFTYLCLYEGRLLLVYEENTRVATVTGYTPIAQRALRITEGYRCPMNPRFEGAFRIEPQLIFVLREP